MFLIMLVGQQISGVFTPFRVVVRSLFPPLVVAGLLYYWFFPVVDWLTRHKAPRWAAIVILYMGIAGVITLVVILIGPVIQRQFISLIDNGPRLINDIRLQLISFQEHEWVARFQQGGPVDFEDIVDQAASQASKYLLALTSNIPSILGMTASFITTLFVIPFILFYMLLEGHMLPKTIVGFLPRRHRNEAMQVLKDMDKTLSSYIQGVIIVSLSVAMLAFIGYTIIGIDYTLLLAIVAGVTNVIPFFGPILGTLPGVLVALVLSPGKALQVVLMIAIIQQIESLLISPRVMGKKIATHPVVIILLVIAAGRLAGLVGIILAIPTFAVVKVIVSHLYPLIKAFRDGEEDSAPPDAI